MDTMKICSGCHKALAPNAPDGLCPQCLIKAGLGTGVDIGPDSQAEGGQIRFVAPTLDELAKLFPQLEILTFIGQGGMGAVYKARQKALDRIVALKILPPGIGKDQSFAQRFTREAKALAKLNHPGIVTLYEFGQADGLFFFLMEFVDGMNLRHLLEVERISPREALAIVPQICDALQYAHDQGIVHRDIKPENILLDRQGRVKVADFGLAKLVGTEGEPSAGEGGVAGSVVLTEAGKVMGTPQYMAPEQREHPAEVDHRADIYSLGVVFYQMLTGELPGKPIEPPSHTVRLDVRLDEVVLRALEKEPGRRYQHASQVKSAVETISQSCPLADANPQPVDWRTWSRFQSQQVREICSHLTEAERREWTLRGVLFGIWNAATFFVPLGIALFTSKPLNWIFAVTVLLVGLAFYPLWQRMTREFLASTSWARQQGIAPESLWMSPHTVLVGRRGDKAVIHWRGVLLRFVMTLVLLILLVVAVGAISASRSGVLAGWIDSRSMGVAFMAAAIFTWILVRCGLRTPVERLPTLDGPGRAGPRAVEEEQKRTGRKVLLGLLAAAVGLGTLGAWMFLPEGTDLTGQAKIVVVAMLFMTIFGGALAALASRGKAARKPAAPSHLSRTAVVALVLSVGGCMVSLLIGLVIFQSWEWGYGSFFAIETAALILGILAWDRRTGKAAVILSFALMLAWIPGTLTHMAQVAPNRLPKESPRKAAAASPNPNRVLEVRCEGPKAYIRAELDDAHELRLFVGGESLGWSARHAVSTPMTATVEASDQVKLEDGSWGRGLVFETWGPRFCIGITPDGPVPYGEFVFRTNAMITQKDGTFTFADIRQSNGTLVPVSVCVRPVSGEPSEISSFGPVIERVEPSTGLPPPAGLNPSGGSPRRTNAASPRQAPVEAPTKLQEIIDAVRKNEALYEDIDAHVAEKYEDTLLKKEPAERQGLPVAPIVDRNADIHSISQSGMFRVESNLKENVYPTGPQSAAQVTTFDGTTTRDLEHGIATIIEGRRIPMWFIRPHMLALYLLVPNVPLSVYLGGHEAIDAYTGSGRASDPRLEYTYLGEEDYRGLTCCKVRVMSVGKKSNTEYGCWELWLAESRNLIPVRVLDYTYRFSKEIPDGESIVEEWREIAPGVWFPQRVSFVSYDQFTLQRERRQKLNWQRELTLKQVSLHPKYERSLFREIKIPDGTVTREYGLDGKLKIRYRAGSLALTGPALLPNAMQRAKNLIIPRFKVLNTTIVRAVDVLEETAKKCDPRGQGVDFVIKEASSEKERITLDLRNISVAQAAERLAEAGHRTLLAEVNALVFSPPAPETNASRTFPLRHILASEMADGLRQILLGRSGMEARPALDNMQLTVTAPPAVLNRVTTFIAVNDWPNRIAPGPDYYYPREDVEHAGRSFFYACSIEDTEGVARMLAPRVLAKLKGARLSAYGVLTEKNDAELVRELRGNWVGKETAVQKVVQAWNRFPLLRLQAKGESSISFGPRYFALAAFEGAPEDTVTLSFISDRTGGTNGLLMIDTLPPWFVQTPSGPNAPALEWQLAQARNEALKARNAVALGELAFRKAFENHKSQPSKQTQTEVDRAANDLSLAKEQEVHWSTEVARLQAKLEELKRPPSNPERTTN